MVTLSPTHSAGFVEAPMYYPKDVKKRILLLAYMFPPILDGGGFRPLAFARYLPEFSYDPIVLTRPDSGDLPLDASQLDTLPDSVRIERLARGFEDAWNHHFRRQLAWLRPLEAALGRPQGSIAEAVAWRVAQRRWRRQWEVSWMSPVIEAGAELIERYRPDAIVATAPPFETLKAGLELHRRSGIPLVADFRDPWTYGVLWKPANARMARSEEAWEARVVREATKVIVVTPAMQRQMVEKYPEMRDKVELVMNGYESLPETGASPPRDRLVLSFVGTIQDRRLPPVLFEALRRLKTCYPVAAADLRFQLIGPSQSSSSLTDRIRSEGVSEMVSWLGAVGHDRCRELMRESHVLLHIEPVMWYAVSSKMFEYLAAGRPILGMVPPGSDDEWFLQECGAGVNAGLEDPDRIAAVIHARWNDWRAGRLTVAIDPAWLGQFHRREQTRKLAVLLDEITHQGNSALASSEVR